MAIGLCCAAFLLAWLTTRRSVAYGVLSVLLVGYFYGIVRANILSSSSHFIFDAALAGCYVGLPWQKYFTDPKLAAIRGWMAILMIWPCLMFLIPSQHFLIQVVGLRGHIFFLPVLLIGASLTMADIRTLCVGLGVLNLAALGFGAAEYVLGVPRFFPPSAVTRIIYISGDVAGGYFRIPAIFANAHAYAANMVASLPFLIGALYSQDRGFWRKLLLIAGVVAAVAGVLMASTRLYFVICALLLCIAAFFTSGAGKNRILVFLAIGIAAYVAATNPRFQRYKQLDAESVAGRIQGSVNRTLLEVAVDYPLGNGLGGAGTSLPYFLASLVQNPISVENEYARIALEQGFPGLALWICFIGWYLTQRSAFWKGPWRASRVMAWWLVLWGLASACIGTGMLTAIPGTFTMLLTMGWLTASEYRGGFAAVPAMRQNAAWMPSSTYQPSTSI